MLAAARRSSHEHPYAHSHGREHDALLRKRSRSFGGPVAVPLGSAYSDPTRPSHRRTASGPSPYHPSSGSSHGHGHAHERGHSRNGHGSIGRHPEFASVVPTNIASVARDRASSRAPSPMESRPQPTRRSSWQPSASSTAPFAPSLKVHRALACTARVPALLYDVEHAPSHLNILAPPSSSLLASLTRRSRAPPTPVPAHTLALPATRPFVPELHLALPVLPGLPRSWSVNAVSMSATDPAHTALTNLDVLHAIHRSLRTPVTRREWDALGAGSTAQKRVTEAYARRCEARGNSQREWDAGVRRSDFLCGRTVFWGVECRADGTCELVFAKPQ